jgi:nitric oxide reductase NorE protein
MRPRGVSTLSLVGVAAADRVKPRRLPGVDGVWVAIGADSVIFAILFMSFMQARLKDPAVFEASRQTLNMHLGGIDTLILLTSSWSVALAIQALKRDLADRLPRYVLGGALTGLMFMVSKSIEYFQKFADGLTPATNDFYMWYFTLTGIHLLHVVFGTCLLTYVWINSRRGAYSSSNRVVPECVASYWHLVDLLWIVIFPLLYLLKAV